MTESQWRTRVLDAEGLVGWTWHDTKDGYCWRGEKRINCIPEDAALFLHEVAHACGDPVPGDQHHAIWADRYTKLVRTHMERTDGSSAGTG